MYWLDLVSLILLLGIAYIIGRQRAKSGKAVGFRSLAIAMLGAYAFTQASFTDNGTVDYHVIAQIISGVSFIGAGLIFKDKSVHNLTTAILVWSMVAIAVLLGLGYIIQAIIYAIIIWLLLIYKKQNYEND